eukprot:tig00020685_g12978.t1
MSAGAARKSTAPTNLQLVDVASGMFGGTTGTLSWSLPTTGPPLAHRVLRDGVEIARVPGTQTSVEVPDLARGLVSTFVVVAVDGASGAESKPLIAGIARDPNSGITLKAVPTASNGSSAQLSWNTPAASDTVTLYKLLVNGQVVATLPPSGIAMNGFEAKSLPSGAVAEVVAVFASGATLSSTPVPISAGGGGSGFGVAIGAARKSTAPTNLQLVDVASGMFGGTTGTLSWSLPTTGPPLAHRVLRDGVEIARVPGTQTSVEVPDLARGLVSTFVVVAVDGASGAESKPLIAGIARDPNSGITLKAVPTASNGSSAQLSWNTPAASDTVTLYKLLVNGQVVATLPPSGIAMNGFEAKSLPSGAVAEVVAVFASGATLSSTPVPISAGGGGSGFGVRAARKSTAPTNLQLVDVASGMFGGTTGTLSWSLPTTGPPLAHRVLRDGVEIARVPGTQTSVEVPDLARGLVSLSSVAVDGASGAESKPLIAGIARDPNSGITLKAVPTASNGSSAQLSWNTPAASDTVTLYKLLVNGQVVATLPPSGIAMNGFEAKSLPSGAVAEVVAVFASGATLSSTPLVDVASGMFGGTTGTLSWSLPTTGPPLAHRVLRDGVEIARVPGTQTSVEVPDLARGLVSTFVVVAVDGASGAESKPLIAGIARDPNSGITLKAVPTASNGSSAQLSWNTPAASDTVTLYKLLVNGQVVATLPPSGIAMNGFEAKSLPSGAVAEVVAVFASGATLSSTPVPISAGGGGSGFGVAIGAARKSTAPTNLQLVDVASGMFGGTTGTLSWSLPTTGPPLAHRVLRDGVEIARVPGTQTSVEVPDLARGLVSTFVVVAVDGASGAESKPLIAGIARDPNSGITLKAVPTASNGSSAQLSWNTPAASDTVTLYKLLVNGQVVATLPPSGIAMNGFEAKSLPSGAVAEVVAVFASGATLSSTPLVDVASGMFGGTTGTLSWSLPTTGPPLAHRVLRDGVEIARVPGTQTSVEVPDLARGLVSTFVVVAVDGASGAESKPLIAGIARDPNSGITLKAVPTASNGSSAQLSWNTPAASDTVTLYKLLVNGQVVATLPPSGIAMNGFEAKSLPSGAVAEVVAVFASGATLSSTPVPISAGAGGCRVRHVRRHDGTLSWSLPTTGPPLAHRVLRDGVEIARVPGTQTSVEVPDLARGLVSTFVVVAVDGASGAESKPLIAGIARDPNSGITLKAVPTASNGSSAQLSWNTPAASDTVTLYKLLVNGQVVATLPPSGIAMNGFEAKSLPSGAVAEVVAVFASGATLSSTPVPISAGGGGSGFGVAIGAARKSTAPTNLQLVDVASGMFGGTTGTLSWSLPTTGPPLAHRVLRDGVEIARVPGTQTSVEVPDLARGLVSTFVVVAVDGASGAESKPLIAGIARDPNSGITLKAVPTASNGSSAQLSWNTPAASDTVTLYKLLVNGQVVATLPPSGIAMNGFEAKSLPSGAVAEVVAVFASGATLSSTPVPISAGGGGSGFGVGAARKSTAPTNLQLVDVASGMFGGTTGTLSWSLPTTGPPLAHRVLRDGVEIARVPGTQTSVEVPDLARGLVSTFVVVAVDGASGAESKPLIAGIARDPNSGITLKAVPTASNGSSAQLSWNTPAASDTVTLYKLLVNGQVVATLPPSGIAMNGFEAKSLPSGAVAEVVAVFASGATLSSTPVPISAGGGGSGFGVGAARKSTAPTNLQLVDVASGMFGGTTGTLSWSLRRRARRLRTVCCATALRLRGGITLKAVPTASNGSSAQLSWNTPAASDTVTLYKLLVNGQVVATLPPSGIAMNGFEARACRRLVDVASGMFGGTTGTLSWSLPTTGPPLAHLDGASGAESKPLIAGIARDPNSGITLKAVPTASNGSSAQLSWNTPAASDTVTLYKLLVNGQVVATLPPSGIAMNGFEAKSLPSGGGSGFGVRAARKSTAPTNLQLVDVASGMFGGTTGTLSWSLPTTGPPLAHRVLRDGVEIARVPGTQTSVEEQSKPLIAGIARDPNSGITLKAVPTASNGSSAQLSWNTPAASDTVTLYKLLVDSVPPTAAFQVMAFSSRSGPVPVAASRVVELQPYDSKARSDKGEEEAPSVAAPGDLELELNKVAQDRHDPKRASCVLTWKAPGSS